MVNAIRLKILTQEGGLALEDEAVSVIAPGELGYLGMLRNHAPLVTTLKPGKFTWKRPDGTRRTLRIGDGLLEIVRNQLTVLTSSIVESATVS